MTPPRGQCGYCLKPVTEQDTAAWPVTGFEVERTGGGANRILGRERIPDAIFHAECVEERLRNPQGPQLELVPDGPGYPGHTHLVPTRHPT